MYSKKIQIKINKPGILNNISDQYHNKVFSSTSSTRNMNKNNNLKLYTDEIYNMSKSPLSNNDYLKEYYYYKYSKNKNNNKKNDLSSYYSKKRFKSNYNIEKPQISNYIMHSETYKPNIINLDRLSKSEAFTIKNPKKNRSIRKSKNSDFHNISKYTLNKEEFEERTNNTNNLNQNFNNSSIYGDFICNSESINRQKLNRSLERGYIDLSRYIDKNITFNKKGINSEKNETLYQSSNASKGVSFIMDYSSNDKFRNNLYIKSPSKININKHTLNYTKNKKNKKPPICNFYYTSYGNILNVKRKNRTPKELYKKNVKIKNEIELSRKKFENMLEIEKKIKNYFLINNISLKDRELYHQSAILIQSNFRAYLSRKKLYGELNKFVGIRLIIELYNKIINSRKINYYKYFYNNMKSYYKSIMDIRNKNFNCNNINKKNYFSESNILKKNYVKEKKYVLKIESSNNFNIIDKKNLVYKKNINQNLIILNEKIENEKKLLENELKKLKLENEILKKNNQIYKLKETTYNNYNNLTKNKVNKDNINKYSENIENVSMELKEIEEKKKNINRPIMCNIKKNINLNDNLWKKQDLKKKSNLNIYNNKSNNNKNSNNNNYMQKYKYLYLKYIINKKSLKIKEYKREKFHQYLNVIKNINNKNKKEELIKIYELKNILNKIKNKLRIYVYINFIKIYYKYLYSCVNSNKPSLYIPKSKIKTKYININKQITDNSKKEEDQLYLDIDKKQKLKNLVNKKIKDNKNFLNFEFHKFYYQGLLNYNIINNNSIINIINTKKNKNYSNQNNDNYINKDKNIELYSFNEEDSQIEKIKILQKLINNIMKRKKEQLKIIFYKFYYNGIIFSLNKKLQKQKNINNNNNNIYIKKGYEYKKNYNKNNNE